MPAALIAARRATVAAVLNALSGVLTLSCVVTAVLIRPDARHMAAGLVVAQFVATLISSFAVSRAVGISIRRERVVSGALALLRYGFPLALTGLAGMFAFQFDRLVVSRNFSACALRRIRGGGGGAAAFGHCPAGCQRGSRPRHDPARRGRRHARSDRPVDTCHPAHQSGAVSDVRLFMLTAPETVRISTAATIMRAPSIFASICVLVPLRVATYGIITQAIGRTRVNLYGLVRFLATTRSSCSHWWAPSVFPALR